MHVTIRKYAFPQRERERRTDTKRVDKEPVWGDALARAEGFNPSVVGRGPLPAIIACMMSPIGKGFRVRSKIVALT
jgi:hypothetical protein